MEKINNINKLKTARSVKWLYVTTQKEETLSYHAAHAEKKPMKWKIYQQRNAEIQSKTYIWAEVFFFL